MTTALIGLGSNIAPEQHLLAAASALKARFSTVEFSQVYQSAAVGMQGDDFYNACCVLEGVPEPKDLLLWLKELEDEHGRDRSKGSWKPRTLDLDLLMYNNEVLDDDLFCYAHVYGPAAELIDMNLPKVESGVLHLVSLRL